MARGGVVGACLLIVLLPDVLHRRPGSSSLRQQSRHATTGAAAHSWLGDATLLTVYGRSFGTEPILGRLGLDRSLNDVGRQLEPVSRSIELNTGKSTRLAIHLIYALAVPCTSRDTCLLYLDDAGVDLVKHYIEPAARRGWLIVLDDQLGRSTPEAEMEHLISRGYLAFDNVEVAFDPEFRTLPGQLTPGIPTGYVTAEELNAAQRELNAYCRQQGLLHRKLLLIHQWTRDMIRDRGQLRTTVRYVQPVVVMDGIGSPADKASMYKQLLGTSAAANIAPGIKLFPPNPYEPSGHVDVPMLSWQQLFGCALISDVDGNTYVLRPVPRVIVLT